MSDSILFLAHRIPFPPDRGDKIRSWNLLRQLGSFGRVHLACFADDEADAGHLAALRAALDDRLGEAHVEVRRVSKAIGGARALIGGKPVSLTLFDSPRLRAFVDRMLARPDVGALVVFSGQMAQFVPAGVRQRFLMDFGDVDSAKFAEYAERGSGPMAWVHRREAALLSAFEREIAARADAVTFVSEAEAAFFRACTGLGNIHALSNGIDVDFFDPTADFPRLDAVQRGEGPLILFSGQMDYAPNVDAVCWFVREVLPLVPGARFAIAGRKPGAEVRALAADPRVLVTGAVADMRSWLDAADVVAAPLRIARGIQNKVLEAMAMARPVVASPAAFEGIEAEPGRDLLVEADPGGMAAAIRSLIESPARARRIGRAGRACVDPGYRWERRLATFADLVAPRHPLAAE